MQGSEDRAACRWGLSRRVPLQVVLSRQYGSEGRFTFTSHTPGDHQICLHSNSTRMALFAGGRLVRGLSLWPQLGIFPLIPLSFEFIATVICDTLGYCHNQRHRCCISVPQSRTRVGFPAWNSESEGF